MPDPLNLQSRIKLNQKGAIPVLGLGVYQMTDGTRSMETMVSALKMGYRHLDTASLYDNEVKKWAKRSDVRVCHVKKSS